MDHTSSTGNQPLPQNARPVVIAGANGFVGSHLARGLAAMGHQVIALVRPNGALERLLTPAIGNPFRGTVIRTDYSADHLKATFAEIKPRVIINAVGYGLDPTHRNLELGFQTNIRIALDIVDCASGVNADVVHIGSAYEYAASNAPIDEYLPINPESFYGTMKASASLLLRVKARELGLRLLIVRPFGIYGPLEAENKFIPAVIRACLSRKPMNCSNGSKIRDYTYIDDVVDGFARIINSNTDWPEVVNLGSGYPIRLRYIVERICAIMDVRSDLFIWGEMPARLGDPPRMVADIRTMERLFEWSPRTKLDVGLQKTIESIRNV
ncbi:NAD(P)-dependent oxidoreductase [Azospirillum sp. BE72]|uniref:NAD-dependent epimerase/dehydratase family protein n=1 Tax=Azospirillum sp. BE72 TaxID=2817776 RepID=UPI002866CD26|nr:NAD(P)-dependent oxidoreductase [Azospirillum sp. BE72]MDR6775105.1 nucleoside-diphosphate-sugar epimerase [Azospirillum sp. BE72]